MGPNDPYGLEVGVDDDCPHKSHSPFFQILGYPVGQRGAGLPLLTDHLALRPVPQIAVEAAPLPLDLSEHPGVLDGGRDLPPVADDSRVTFQAGLLLRSIGAHSLQVEAVKGPGKSLPLIEDTLPGQSSLKILQDQHFKELLVVVDGDPPLLIVVLEVPGVVGVSPRAPCLSIWPVHAPPPHSAVPRVGVLSVVTSIPSKERRYLFFSNPPA